MNVSLPPPPPAARRLVSIACVSRPNGEKALTGGRSEEDRSPTIRNTSNRNANALFTRWCSPPPPCICVPRWTRFSCRLGIFFPALPFSLLFSLSLSLLFFSFPPARSVCRSSALIASKKRGGGARATASPGEMSRWFFVGQTLHSPACPTGHDRIKISSASPWPFAWNCWYWKYSLSLAVFPRRWSIHRAAAAAAAAIPLPLQLRRDRTFQLNGVIYSDKMLRAQFIHERNGRMKFLKFIRLVINVSSGPGTGTERLRTRRRTTLRESWNSHDDNYGEWFFDEREYPARSLINIVRFSPLSIESWAGLTHSKRPTRPAAAYETREISPGRFYPKSKFG